MSEDIIYNHVFPKCKVDGCDEAPVVYWPAYEPDMSPEPYCQKHYEEAKKDFAPKRPEFLKMSDYHQ